MSRVSNTAVSLFSLFKHEAPKYQCSRYPMLLTKLERQINLVICEMLSVHGIPSLSKAAIFFIFFIDKSPKFQR